MEEELLFPPTIPSLKRQFNAFITFNEVQQLPLIHAPIPSLIQKQIDQHRSQWLGNYMRGYPILN